MNFNLSWLRTIHVANSILWLSWQKNVDILDSPLHASHEIVHFVLFCVTHHLVNSKYLLIVLIVYTIYIREYCNCCDKPKRKRTHKLFRIIRVDMGFVIASENANCMDEGMAHEYDRLENRQSFLCLWRMQRSRKTLLFRVLFLYRFSISLFMYESMDKLGSQAFKQINDVLSTHLLNRRLCEDEALSEIRSMLI